ncbi:uncharacterized protein SPAPADRAFT_138715 [Spathaspora passalidarum NRRL Y-27907]|uniref:Mediator of RNA polymerase II transcription subunit 14 n=1 Tax=Spathaspora passalidarum (strain NRRL Y-27907 / 11-Y1) TaxID=619300 RepID=G3AP18_SPAPN|nr:uncharacterized protein SPAPADRAFT_138715 [Spathaspora passalidarum NRRL Y-27907]EGW32049.1 hypothetical protein SPAPADRAFT_138715 [Spathaspora passalidarum NRRL Y-27907]
MNEDINGQDTSKVPPLPHVTTNILPLSSIIHFHTQEAYKQFTTAIDNLAADQSNDVKRKKQFLELIISLRHDFVKLYTLVKWCSNSADVSKLIDLLNWLRQLEFSYDQLLYTMNTEFGNSQFNYGTKLPNSDLITSLQVLYKQRPQLASYGYLRTDNDVVSSEKILEVLKELNLVLTIRFALMNDVELPPRFNNNYEIKDGKCFITIPNEYQLVITTISQTSPFYLIDFKFLFGINQETLSISHNSYTKLPPKSYKKLEKIVNTVFNTSTSTSLTEVYELLHKYSMSFKLYLIAKQIKELMVNSKWRNNIDLNYSIGRNSLILNYWSSHYLSKNYKSFIELGIDRNYNLNYRWFKNGQYQQTDMTEIFIQSQPEDNEEVIIDDDDDEGNDDHPHDLNVDVMLNVIVNKHAELLMSSVFERLAGLLSPEEISQVNSHQLLVKLSHNKSTIFAINPLTGYFYFIDPITIQQAITKKINTAPSTSSKFISEDDLINNIIDQIIQLRLLVYTKEINNKLLTSQWINNDIITLSETELSKLGNSGKCQFYRVKKWPSSWFLINSINGINNSVAWYVARIKSIKGEWKIQWKNKISHDSELNYGFFSGLATICSNMIIDHMIIEELQTKHIKYFKVDADKERKVLAKFGIKEKPSVEGTIYQSLIMIYNDELLPINNSSTSLFLQIQLLSDHKMNLTLFGNLRNLSIIQEDYSQLNLTIIEENFEFKDTVNLSTATMTERNLLSKLFNNLNQFNKLIKILDQLNNNHIQIVSNTINDITINIDGNNLTILLPEESTMCIQLTTTTENSQLRLILEYLNRYLHTTNTSSVIGIIKYLQTINPILNAITTINKLVNKQTFRLSNGLSRLNFDVTLNTLNSIQFIFHISSSTNSKKIIKDKITVNISFKNNKFDKQKRNLVKISLRDNLIDKNLKFKKLFELIFKSINDLEQTKKNDTSVALFKLNYDFLISGNILEELLERIGNSFISYLQLEKS